MSLEKTLSILYDNGYDNIRVLDDGTIIATIELLYTRAVVIDLNDFGYDKRYCYSDRELATAACLALTSGDETPLAGFVATRGV